MYKKALTLSALFGFLSIQPTFTADTFLGTQTPPLINSLPVASQVAENTGAIEEFCGACTENQGSGGSGYALAFGEGGETIYVGSDGTITLDNGSAVNNIEVITEETLIQILETIIIETQTTQTFESSVEVTTGSTGGGWHLNPAEENVVIPGVGEIIDGTIILESNENVVTEGGNQGEIIEETAVEEVVVEQTPEESSTGAVGVVDTGSEEQNNTNNNDNDTSSGTNSETSDSSDDDDDCEDKGGLICGIKNVKDDIKDAAHDVKDGLKDAVHDVGSGIKNAVKSLFNHD